jgi:hypothetical protein
MATSCWERGARCTFPVKQPTCCDNQTQIIYLCARGNHKIVLNKAAEIAQIAQKCGKGKLILIWETFDRWFHRKIAKPELRKLKAPQLSLDSKMIVEGVNTFLLRI